MKPVHKLIPFFMEKLVENLSPFGRDWCLRRLEKSNLPSVLV